MIPQQTRGDSFEKIKPALGLRHQEIIALLQANIEGLTAWELASLLGRPVYVVRPRLTELQQQSVIEPVSKRFHSETDRSEAVWRMKVWKPTFDREGRGKLFDEAEI